MVELRNEHPVFRRRRFFAGDVTPSDDTDVADIVWFTPAGEHKQDWGDDDALMVFLNGDGIPEPDQRGERCVGRLVPDRVQPDR